MLDEKHPDPPQDDKDRNIYTLGTICLHNVVIACLPAGLMGTTSSATVAVQMKLKFPSIRFGLMVGIGGGVSTAGADIRLGDVVISQPHMGHGGVVQYDFGKTTPDKFEHSGFLNAPPTILLNALANIQANHFTGESQVSRYLSAVGTLPAFSRDTMGPDILFESSYNHLGGATCDNCSKEKVVVRAVRSEELVVHYGTIASGGQVMKDGTTRDRISSELGGALCFEMEAAGLMNDFPCLVIRGISDYADSHKNKRWQGYAAATAAACAKEVLAVMPAAELWKSMANKLLKIRAVIDDIDLEQFLAALSVVDQSEHIKAHSPATSENPRNWWIFRNCDFKKWDSSLGPQVLCLSGQPTRKIQEVSAYLFNREQKRALDHSYPFLYFSYSNLKRKESITKVCVHTLLFQFLHSSPEKTRVTIAKKFLHCLVDRLCANSQTLDHSLFKEAENPKETIEKLLNATIDGYFFAFKSVLIDEKHRGLFLGVDGLDWFGANRSVNGNIEFIEEIRAWVTHLQSAMTSVKCLVASAPDDNFTQLFSKMPFIEYDRERRECLASLRFDNTRYAKIADQHEGSFRWIWTHNEYKSWADSDSSRLLYLQGKPGSGKSTLAKYFNENLLNHDPRSQSAIVAKFFYSYREGEVQKSHYNMLRTILFHILDQCEAFFYHCCQDEYRRQLKLHDFDQNDVFTWQYKSLQTLLLSPRDFFPIERLYLIVDAVDESEEHDRREILELLVKLCSETKYFIVKVFIASRPAPVLERYISKMHNLIRLQDETRSDIYSFAGSFLERLEFTDYLAEAADYIVDNAQGVFLWVRLVSQELLSFDESGRPKEDIFKFLKSLPTELEDFYRRMLQGIRNDKANIPDALKLFRLVLFAHRPLLITEILHAFGMPDDPSKSVTLTDETFQERIPSERRIVSCSGNFVEVKEYEGNSTAQVMHQTVRELFLSPSGYVANTEFRMCPMDANLSISITCLRYVMLCVSNCNNITPPRISSWSLDDFAAIGRYLNGRPLMKYALSYLKRHIDACQQDGNVAGMVSQLAEELKCNLAVCIFGKCISVGFGVDDMTQNFVRNRTLQAAASHGFHTAVDILLTAGALPGATDEEAYSPLAMAAREGHENVVQLLLDRKTGFVGNRDVYGNTELSLAALNGHELVVKILLNHGDVNINTRDKNGRTPLSLAAENGHEPVIKILLDNRDIDPDANDHTYRSPLSWAAQHGRLAVVELLLQKLSIKPDTADGGSLPSPTKTTQGPKVGSRRRGPCSDHYDGRTPLSWAAQNGHTDIIKKILSTILLSAVGANASWQVPAEYAITPSSNGRFLVDGNGDPFFWQADTAWLLFHRLNYSEAETYLSDRASKGFTVALAVGYTQIGIASPNRNGDLTFIDLDPTKPNEPYWSYVDSIVALAWSKGIRICPINATTAKTFGQFIGHRYPYLPKTLVGDTNPWWENKTAVKADYANGGIPPTYKVTDWSPVYDDLAMGIVAGERRAIATAASGRRNTGTWWPLMTIHPTNQWFTGGPVAVASAFFGNRQWLTLDASQSGHADFPPNPPIPWWNCRRGWEPVELMYATGSKSKARTRPVIDNEAHYENRYNNGKSLYSYWNASDVRVGSWQAVFAGAAGVTYGANAIQQMSIPGLYSSDGTGPNADWVTDLDAPGSGQMKWLKKVITDRGNSTYLTRVPAQDIIVGDAGTNDLRVAATRDSGGSWIIVYTPTGKPFQVETKSLGSCEVDTNWYDPTTGVYTAFGYSPCGEGGTSTKFTPPTASGHVDWALVLEVVK
ncbi:hypothetical protein FE257_009851 [Aspergillus nanangensis]|uniref:NACHT domain-containing protein n=1 Tax=Aspergillus nanangensis TaxID=2582783 RepID=A0AAD4GZH7_ASPNN|nr:hypothetical protein FE257_009851 [Aspergillus nanangensis]